MKDLINEQKQKIIYSIKEFEDSPDNDEELEVGLLEKIRIECIILRAMLDV